MRYNVIFDFEIASEASKDYHYELTCDRFHRKLSLLDNSVRPHLRSWGRHLLFKKYGNGSQKTYNMVYALA